MVGWMDDSPLWDMMAIMMEKMVITMEKMKMMRIGGLGSHDLPAGTDRRHLFNSYTHNTQPH